MTARDFVFWLQGTLELGRVEALDKDQVKILREHLDLVFRHDIAPVQPGTEAETPHVPTSEDLQEAERASRKIREELKKATGRGGGRPLDVRFC